MSPGPSPRKRSLDLRRLPKIELHRHLAGSIRFRTVNDIRGRVPVRRHHFVRNERRGWDAFFRKFHVYREMTLTPAHVRRIAAECVRDAADDGVIYLELRFSPMFFAMLSGLDPLEVTKIAVREARAEARRRKMDIRFLAMLQRQKGPRFNAPSVDAAVTMRPWFVGVDVAGDERNRPDLSDYVPLFDRALRAGLRLTIHAGEGGGPGNVRDAILRWGASRIGHGVQAVRDPLVLDLAARRRVTFEMCPTSNRDTCAWRDIRTHPIRKLLRAGVPVTINTDDPAVSNIDLTHECRVARTKIGLTDDEIIRLQRNAIEGAFLSEPSRRALRGRFERLLKGR